MHKSDKLELGDSSTVAKLCHPLVVIEGLLQILNDCGRLQFFNTGTKASAFIMISLREINSFRNSLAEHCSRVANANIHPYVSNSHLSQMF